MKNYNEMANDVLRRIGEYENEQRNRRKVMKKVIIPICCSCLVALLGIGLWQGDFFGNTPPVELNDSTILGEQDYIVPETNNQSGDVGDVIGMVKYGGANYVQCSTSTKTYTPDKYLGEAYDFEGTYQIGFDDIVGGLYMTKEDPDVLMVELKNGEYTEYVILIKEQNQSDIIEEQDYTAPEVNYQSGGVSDVIGMVKYSGANYVKCSTSTKTYTPDKYLGEAYDFEGTYQIGFDDIVGGLYMTKEDPDVLVVELKNSEYTDYVILIKEQNQSDKRG